MINIWSNRVQWFQIKAQLSFMSNSTLHLHKYFENWFSKLRKPWLKKDKIVTSYPWQCTAQIRPCFTCVLVFCISCFHCWKRRILGICNGRLTFSFNVPEFSMSNVIIHSPYNDDISQLPSAPMFSLSFCLITYRSHNLFSCSTSSRVVQLYFLIF